MKSKVGRVLILVLAVSLACWGRNDESIEQLITRADTAPAGQQPDLYMQIAEQETKLASASYKTSNLEQARAALREIVKYADKARAAAIHSGKRVKHTEIKLRQVAGRLRDLKSNVDADDQPLVEKAVDKLEDFRTELLKDMFGSKNRD